MENTLIAITALCSHYEIEISFIDALHQTGLIQIEIIEENKFLKEESINDLEKMIRLHHELDVNLEGIDVIFNLLEKERILNDELMALKNRLRRYETD